MSKDKKSSDSDEEEVVNIPPGHGGLIKTPAKNDVLSGRGGRVNAHEGNIRFRNLVGELKHEYVSKSTKKLDKAQIAAKIVRLIRKSDPSGRFLKMDTDSNLWIEIGDDKARKKAGQALREDAPEVRGVLDKEKEDNDKNEQMKKLLEFATQLPYSYPPGYFPNMAVGHPAAAAAAAAYGMASPFAANMVGGAAPMYPTQTHLMMPEAAATALFYQQQHQANAAFRGMNPYGVYPGMAAGQQGFMPTPATHTAPVGIPTMTTERNEDSTPPESITMPSIPTPPKIPGIQPTNPNPPQVATPSTVVAPFGNAPSHSFANLSKNIKTTYNTKENFVTRAIATKEQYRDDHDDEDFDDESEQKTEAEDMSLVSQMQNSHVSEPSKDPKETDIWASSRKGQMFGQKHHQKTRPQQVESSRAGDSSAVGSTVTPTITNASSRNDTNHPQQVVIKKRNSNITAEENPLPRVLEEGGNSSHKQQANEDIFDGQSMKSVNTFNCSEMNDLHSLSGNSFEALMNGDDFSVAQKSIMSELSDLQSLDARNQQQMYEMAVKQVNQEYEPHYQRGMSAMEQQHLNQMYFNAVREKYSQLLHGPIRK